MPQPSAFDPVWPPVSADVFEAWPEVREARKMYERQKLALHGLANEGLAELTGKDAHRLAQEIAVLCPNISGAAAHFGEAPMGLRAGEPEQAVRTAKPHNSRLRHARPGGCRFDPSDARRRPPVRAEAGKQAIEVDGNEAFLAGAAAIARTMQ